MSKREPGLDLLRCIALLFVVIFHSFLNNGYYSEPQVGASMWLAGSFRWLSVSCIGLFLMLTGYLKCEKTDIKVCYRGLLPVLIAYFLAAIISIPIRHFLFGDTQSFSTWLSRLFSFSAVYYGWYVEMYIGLVLLIPFVNMVLERLQDAKALLGLCAVMLVITALPGATPIVLFPDHWRVIYPLTYYILGAAVRKLQPRIHPLIGVFCAISVSAVLGAATVLSTDSKLSEALVWEFADLWIACIVVCLFVSLYRIRIPASVGHILAFGASGCYGGYLLSHLFDAWCYKLLPSWRTPDRYALVFFCITLPIFIVSVLLGVMLERISNRLSSHRKGASKCLR